MSDEKKEAWLDFEVKTILKAFFFFFVSLCLIFGFYGVFADYQYSFHSLFSENGTYTGSTQVTVYFPNGTSDSFTADVFTWGKCVQFDGADTRIVVGDDPILDVGRYDFSFELWVLHEGSDAENGQMSLLDKGGSSDADDGFRFLLRDEGTYWYPTLAISNGTIRTWNAATTISVSENVWHYLAVTGNKSTGEVIVYLDDSTTQTFNEGIPAGLWNDALDLWIGDYVAGGGSRAVKGWMDNIRYWNGTILTPSQILKHYNDGYGRYNPVTSTGLETNWLLDDGAGVNVEDSQGLDQNGTLTVGAGGWRDGLVDEITIQTYDEIPYGFEWNVSYTTINRWYVPLGLTSEHFWLFDPDATADDYLFIVKDYAGYFPAYWETYRYINDTKYPIERKQVTSTHNQIPMVMVTGETYFIQVKTPTSLVYDFGQFIPGSDVLTFSLTVPLWGEQAQTVYGTITAEATRPIATSIRLVYQDTTQNYDTENVTMTVEFRNGTEAYSTFQNYTNTVVFNWNSANNESDYVVELYADHEYFGDIYQTWVLDYARTFNPMPSLDIFGSWGGLPTANLLTLFVGFIVAGGTLSFRTKALAPFLFMAIMSMFTFLGGATFTNNQLMIGWVVALIMGIILYEGGKG